MAEAEAEDVELKNLIPTSHIVQELENSITPYLATVAHRYEISHITGHKSQ
jgi:hypothetical protein